MLDALRSLFQHTAITDGVSVHVAVTFMPEQSRIEAGKWFWVYHIRIENGRDDTIRLLTRHWRITDARGMISLVDGEGVVGETPILAPGETHDYVSGCPLATPIGMGCKVCERQDCPQRAFPPAGRSLNVDETRSYFAPYATSR